MMRSEITIKVGAAYPDIDWATDLLLPLPLGEGRGEGSANRIPAFRFASQPTTASPHPSPLPEGEGTEKVTIKVGAASEGITLARGQSNA